MTVNSMEQPVLRSMSKEGIAFFTSVCVAATIFVLLYFETLSEIVAMWGTYRGSHGPVILAISLYMIWLNGDKLKQIPSAPHYLLGIVVTMFGCFLLAAGRVGSVLLLQYLSLVVSLWGLILLIGGDRFFGILWYPVGYLGFMFPIFSEVLDKFSIYLQTTAAWIAATIMSVAGIAVYQHGHVLDLPMITLDVAKECNGVNHIMALVSLAIPLAYWSQQTWIKRAILIALAFPIGVIANGLRVSVIGLYAYYQPGDPVHGPYDLFYVSFIFFFGMGALIGLSRLLRSKEPRGDEGKLCEASTLSYRTQSLLRQGVAFAVAISILLSTWMYVVMFKPEVVALAQPIETFPYEINRWKGQDLADKESMFGEFLADIELQRVYFDKEGGQFKLYIGYFPVQSQDKEVVHYRFDSLQENAKPFSLRADGSVTIKMTSGRESSEERTACFWYVIHDAVITDRYAAKLATISGALLHRKTNAAIVVIEFPGEEFDQSDIAVVEGLFPVIQSHLRTG